MVTDVSGRSHVYNSVPLDLGASIPGMAAVGVSAFRLDLELDDAGAAAAHTRRFRQLLERTAMGVVSEHGQRDSKTTSGHYFRGVH